MNLSGPHRMAGDEVQYQFCPVCGGGKWRFFINRKTGVWYCHVGRHQGARTGKVDAGFLPKGPAMREMPQQVREITLPTLRQITHASPAHQYLASRSISVDTQRRLGLADWHAESRIFIPFTGEKHGDIIGYTGRDYSGTAGLKYRNNPGAKALYVPDRTTGGPEGAHAGRVVVVEGPFDAIACYQSGHPAVRCVALGGKRASAGTGAELARLVAGRSVLVWLDPDALKESLALVRELAPHAKAVQLHRDRRFKDAAECPPDVLSELLTGG